MLKEGVILTSSSPWCNHVVFVWKPFKELRFCIYCWCLDALAARDVYPVVVRVDDIFSRLSRVRYFCSGNLLFFRLYYLNPVPPTLTTHPPLSFLYANYSSLIVSYKDLFLLPPPFLLLDSDLSLR